MKLMPIRLAHCILLLAFASGMAALGHQLLWTRRLVDLLGASAESTTRVFGCFFLGLALGAALAGMIAHRVKRPWRAVGLAEIGIAALSLPVMFLPSWTQWIWPALGEQGLTGWPGGATKLVLSVLTILPPAVCMGMVLPFILKGLRHLPATQGQGIRLYATNTLGGAIGLLLTVLIVLPKLGVGTAMVVAASLNLLIAAVMFWLDRGTPALAPEEQAPAGDPLPRWTLAISFFSGAAILAMEVAATRMFMLVASLSFFAPAAILFAVITTLAVAAFVAMRWERKKPSPAQLPIVMCLTAIATFLGPFIFFAIVERTGSLAQNATVTDFVFKLVALALLTIGPGILLGGLVFPLAMSSAEITGSRGPSRLAKLLAINGVGGMIGAESAWRFLLPNLGVHGSIGAIAITYAVVGGFLAWKTLPQVKWRIATACLLLALFGALPRMQALPLVNAHAGLTVLDHQAGREGTVAVVESDWAGRSILMSNQYLLGSTAARWDQERQAHLPLLLHHAPRDIAFIGLATGITSGAALSHPDLDNITAVELSPLVQSAAKHYFGEFNNGITHDKRARIVTEDGRTYIAACPGKFDVVIGDLFLPWGPGEARLFSIEHFRAVRDSLREGGLFCQWLPMYQLTPRQFNVIAHTFQTAFPNTALFYNGFGGNTPALALVGFRDGQSVDWSTVQRHCTKLRKSGALLDPLLRHPQGVAMLHLGKLGNTPPDLPINTLGNLWLELDAASERLTGKPGGKYFFGGRWFQFCQQRRASIPANSIMLGSIGQQTELLRLAGLWMHWEHARKHNPAVVAGIARRLRIDTPAVIRNDSGADWTRWGGTAVPWNRPSSRATDNNP